MSNEEKHSDKVSHVILQKPLPEILDDIGISIQESEAAAADARKAAEEARWAGESAADAVMKKIRGLLLRMADDITKELKQP
ncbi:MAG: hypothetical protein FWH51_01580 [Dehalococcoidia bacterium]|nr:hypothetical protein [Dehalococcoidia bacterium]